MEQTNQIHSSSASSSNNFLSSSHTQNTLKRNRDSQSKTEHRSGFDQSNENQETNFNQQRNKKINKIKQNKQAITYNHNTQNVNQQSSTIQRHQESLISRNQKNSITNTNNYYTSQMFSPINKNSHSSKNQNPNRNDQKNVNKDGREGSVLKNEQVSTIIPTMKTVNLQHQKTQNIVRGSSSSDRVFVQHRSNSKFKQQHPSIISSSSLFNPSHKNIKNVFIISSKNIQQLCRYSWCF